jgi:hypothetical protein
MIVTMLILPPVAVGVAIASKAPPTTVLRSLNLIGLIAAAANLALVVIAGLAPGKAEAAEPMSRPPSVPPPWAVTAQP